MAGRITKSDEKRFIYNLAHQDCFSQPLSFDKVIKLISNNEILLEIESDQSKIIINKENIEQIEKTMPFLLKIADKPKSFISLYEEKVPVETAKRINHKAIMKLSRDSNDWHARTLLSIKPKNIVADINEETFNIYENRFVISLVDKISRLLKDAKKQYLLKKKLFEQDRISEKMKGYFHTSENFAFLNQINKSKSFIDDTFEIVSEINAILEKIDILDRKIKIFTSSKFYQTLRKCRRVKNPIQKTNILMFSPDYNSAYRLWNNLSIDQEEPTIDVPEDYECEKPFVLYSVLNIFAALKDMGYRETTGSTLKWNIEKQMLSLSKELVFQNSFDILKLDYSNGVFSLKTRSQIKPIEKWGIINIHTNYQDFEETQKYDVEKITTEILNSLATKKEESWEQVVGQFCFISAELIRRDETSQLSEKLYKRLYNLGDNFSSEEKETDISKWGNHKTGFVNITPVSLKLNFLRVERLFNILTIPYKMKNDRAEKKHRCPICGDQNVKEIATAPTKGHETYSFVCKNCQHIFSYSYCSSCNSDIYWVKYSEEKFLDNEEVISGDFLNKPIISQLSDLEVVAGTHSITGFVLEKENTGYKLKTICPKCGKQLGQNK